MPEAVLSAQSLCEGVDVPADVIGFAHTPGTRVVFGVGAAEQTGALVASLASGRVLVVTDPGIARAGHCERIVRSLKSSDLSPIVFDKVHENPTTDDVAACVEAARDASVSAIVGLGGGSSMDTAKGCNFILTNGGEMRDYWGVGKATRPMLPFIAVPTTAGTGSECQSFALIADAKTHRKMACGDRKAAAAIAVLDPTLTMTQPSAVTAHTGIDALAHAIETAVTKKRTDISRAYSRLAFHLLDRALEVVIADPSEVRARAAMQLGAAYAGTAIENSMLGAAHAAANPLTARFDIIHGEAVGIMLAHVIRLNRNDPASAAAYRDLAEGDLADRVESLMESAGLRAPLASFGVKKADLPDLAHDAADQWTAAFNPVPCGPAEFEQLYRAALQD